MGVNYNTLAAFLKIKPPSRTNILHIDIRKRAIRCVPMARLKA